MDTALQTGCTVSRELVMKMYIINNIQGVVQACSISSVLAVEILQSYSIVLQCPLTLSMRVPSYLG